MYHRRMKEKPVPPPSRVADKLIVRLPDGMREKIAEASKQNSRSMTAEVVARLATSFDAPPAFPAHLIEFINDFAKKNGLDPQQTAELVVRIGLSRKHMLVLRPSSGMTLKEMEQLFATAARIMSEDTMTINLPEWESAGVMKRRAAKK